jgi:hypothetical protein
MEKDEVKRRSAQRRGDKEANRRRGHASRVRRYHQRKRQAYLSQRFKVRREYADINAPSVFSILDNRSAVISYLKSVDRSLKNRVYTRLQLSGIERTDLATICLLSAYMLDYRTKSEYLEVVIPPKASKARPIWDEVQFERMIINKQRPNFSSGRFLSRSNKAVNEPMLREISNAALDFFGNDKQEVLINLPPMIVEITENTAAHAFPKKISRLPSIINTHTMTVGGRMHMEFCVVDLGVGMYDSIKANVDKWNTTKHKLYHRLTSALDNAHTQSKFLSNNIPKGIGSSTNERTRGKGVQYVHEIAQEVIFDRFDIITNKAHVRLKDTSIIEDDSAESLEGTIYFWRVTISDD